MSNESTNEAPVTLTDDQATLVSGGTLSMAVFAGGCPHCTSGLQLAFQDLVTNPVLPAQQQSPGVLADRQPAPSLNKTEESPS